MHGHGGKLFEKLFDVLKPKYSPKNGFETNAMLIEKSYKGVEVIDLED